MSALGERELELLHREADGLNGAGESAEVAALVSSSPEAGRLLADLRRIASGLEQIGRSAPPDTLRPSILRAVERRAVVDRAQPVRPVVPTRDARRAWRYAAAFALGGLVVAVVGELAGLSGARHAPEQLSGTMAPRPRAAVADDAVRLVAPGTEVAMRWVEEGGQRAVAVELDARAPAGLRLASEPRGVEFTGIVRRGGSPLEIELAAGQVELRAAGPASVLVSIGDHAPAGAAVDASLLVDGQPRARARLVAPGTGRPRRE